MTSRAGGGRRSAALPIARALARRRHLAAILAAGLWIGSIAPGPAAAQDQTLNGVRLAAQLEPARLVDAPASSDAGQMFDWVLKTHDNRGMPFVIVDKKDARVLVFNSRGRLLGATGALLGLARGDDSVPGIGERKLSDIRPQERTTPAGRFVASLGHGLGKQDILWVDYTTALALHRVLATNSNERRLERLATASPLDHRITFGCINVPARFYDDIVHPAFTGTSGVVYILPEVKTLSEVFFSSTS
jgi:hypothetical protein